MNTALLEPQANTWIGGHMRVRSFGRFFKDGVKLERKKPQSFANIANVVGPETNKLFMPAPPKMNGLIAEKKSFSRVRLNGTVPIYAGTDADGVVLAKGEASATLSGGCPVITLSNGVVFHAGLKSIVQFSENEKGAFAVQKHNVVKNAIEATDSDPKTLTAYIVCGVQTGFEYSIYNPEYGETNLALQNWCLARHHDAGIVVKECINMVALVRAELLKAGLLFENILDDGVDTFGDRDLFGNHEYASHPRSKDSRNLVLVEYL